MSIRANLEKIRSGLPAGVTLVAVSKTKPVELIREAYENGQRDFGENYVQELVSKHEQLPKDIRWHFIGHLQSNKVKYIAPFVHLIHGIDSVKLLEEVNKQGSKLKRQIPCLLQIHIAQEESKFGFSYDEARQMMRSGQIEALRSVKVSGLMGMASNTSDEAHLRSEYSKLRQFFDEQSALHPDIKVLSCGMSGDYQLAVTQGSNLVRIGSSIFGEREYGKKE